MMDLWTAIQQALAELDEAVEEMRKLGEDRAEADAGYRSTKAVAILREKARGTPASICRDVIYRREDVKAALMKRDCADAVYEASKERINSLKLSIRVLEAQHEREWNQAKRSF